jgi:amino-acid N-acetyltransferase
MSERQGSRSSDATPNASTALQADPSRWREAVFALLRELQLPTDGVNEHLHRFILESDNDRLIGCAGLEVHGDAGLLRSVAVHPAWRAQGIAARLVARQLETANDLGLSSIGLLTTSAAEYFERFGFLPVPRSSLPSALLDSAQLRGACPDSAQAMLLNLQR